MAPFWRVQPVFKKLSSGVKAAGLILALNDQGV